VLVPVTPLSPSAAGELLTLQRAAYVTEAQRYGDPLLPALVQSLDALVAELATSRCLAAIMETRLVGSVRTQERDGVLHVGRLVVAPDLQGRGLGSRLLLAAEEGSSLPRATLFTGALSEPNLRLYRRHGYVESHRERQPQGPELVHLVKDLT
jgi:GNAT superfamily N-acetyltransferase